MLFGFEDAMLEGSLVTLKLGLTSLVYAIVLGLVACVASLSSVAGVSLLSRTYTSVIRGIPDLVLMLLIFFGGQILVNALAPEFGYQEYIDINPFIAASITLGFIYGAYMAETFRGAFLSIPQGQIEAAQAYALSPVSIFFRIKVPQLFRFALPGIMNNWMVLIKSTALASAIGMEDLVRKAALASGSTRKPFVFWIAVGVIYLLFTTVSLLCEKWIEKRYRWEIS